MPYPSVTNSFSSSTIIESLKVNANNTDITDALSDGTKSFNLYNIQCSTVSAGTANITVANINNLIPSDIKKTIIDLGNISSKPYYHFQKPRIYDLKSEEETCSGFSNCFSDGKYVYFTPYDYYTFTRIRSYEYEAPLVNAVLDLSSTDADLKGFSRGCSDGRYAYLIPYYNGSYFGKLTRVDLDDFSTVDVLDLTLTASDLKGFSGSFIFSHYLYCVPYKTAAGTYSGKMARVDLSDFSTVTTLDLSSVNSNYKGFYGGFTDGVYGYLVPYENALGYHGYFIRINLEAFTYSGVINLTNTYIDLYGYKNGFTDGRFAYLVPNIGSYFAKIDLSDFSTVSYLDVTYSSYCDGVAEGRYCYLIPEDGNSYFARIDLNDFDTISSYRMIDIDSDLRQFKGGCINKNHLYLSPYSNDVTAIGKIARIFLRNGIN